MENTIYWKQDGPSMTNLTNKKELEKFGVRSLHERKERDGAIEVLKQ